MHLKVGKIPQALGDARKSLFRSLNDYTYGADPKSDALIRKLLHQVNFVFALIACYYAMVLRAK